MYRIISFFILVLSLHAAVGQDVIVTNENDTIDCKITRVSEEFIHFSVYDKSGVLLMRSRLPTKEIQYFEQSDTVEEEAPADKSQEAEERLFRDEFVPPHFRLGLNTGFTYQFGGYDGLPSSYQKQVQTLWNFGADFYYYPSVKFGIGLKYNHAFTKANEDFEPPYSSAFGFSQLRDEHIKFNYYALSIAFREFYSSNQSVNYFLAGGLIKYRTDLKADGIPYTEEGETIGFVFGATYDFIFSENFGAGVGIEVNFGQLTELVVNGNRFPADFSITRVDLTIGMRLYK